MGREIDPEKLLDMIRSILPSTAPRHARFAKAFENRLVRREVRATLQNDDLEFTRRDVKRDSQHASTVMWRRGADKLAHFMRWCEALTEGMSRQEKLDYVRGILPRNVIGDHAYSHWEAHCRPGFGLLSPHNVPYREQLRRGAQSRYDSLRTRLRRALQERPEILGELNAAVKRCKEAGEPYRVLFGIHDVDAFARDVLQPGHQKERAVAERYIEHGRPSGRPRHLGTGPRGFLGSSVPRFLGFLGMEVGPPRGTRGTRGTPRNPRNSPPPYNPPHEACCRRRTPLLPRRLRDALARSGQ